MILPKDIVKIKHKSKTGIVVIQTFMYLYQDSYNIYTILLPKEKLPNALFMLEFVTLSRTKIQSIEKHLSYDKLNNTNASNFLNYQNDDEFIDKLKYVLPRADYRLHKVSDLLFFQQVSLENIKNLENDVFYKDYFQLLHYLSYNNLYDVSELPKLDSKQSSLLTIAIGKVYREFGNDIDFSILFKIPSEELVKLNDSDNETLRGKINFLELFNNINQPTIHNTLKPKYASIQFILTNEFLYDIQLLDINEQTELLDQALDINDRRLLKKEKQYSALELLKTIEESKDISETNELIFY